MTCPCCDGLREGDYFDLCDDCLAASAASHYPHDELHDQIERLGPAGADEVEESSWEQAAGK